MCVCIYLFIYLCCVCVCVFIFKPNYTKGVCHSSDQSLFFTNYYLFQ